MKRFAKFSTLIVFTVFLLASTAQALLPNFSPEELIARCDGIVLGTVREVSSSWAEDHSQIFTYVTLEVSEQFKGQPLGDELVLQIPGGTVGAITQTVSDTPTLVPGMQVVVHTFVKESGYTWIYGWEKGVLTVENGTVTDYNMSLPQFRTLVESVIK